MPPHIPPGGKNYINQRRGPADGFATKSQSNLPSDIICFVCKKSKPRTEYANRQLQRFSDTIHNPYAPGGRTRTNPKTTCKSCTPQQVSQLTCMICDKTKPLDKFAKGQRKNPHTARCESCVKMHLETEPDYEPPDSDEYDDENDSESDFDDGEKPQSSWPAGGDTSYARFKENVSAPSHAASAFTEDAPGEAGDDGWLSVETAGSRPIAKQPPLPELHGTASVARSSATTSTTTKKKGWAKPEKSNEAKYGPNPEADQWDTYARNLKNRRDGSSKQGKKKKPTIDDQEYDS